MGIQKLAFGNCPAYFFARMSKYIVEMTVLVVNLPVLLARNAFFYTISTPLDYMLSFLGM
jgi:hypothetical protein